MLDSWFGGVDDGVVKAAAEGIGGPDRHLAEPGAPQRRLVLVDGDGALAAVDEGCAVAVVAVADDVTDPDPSAAPQDAGDLGEHGVLVGREDDDAVGDHDVDRAVVERDVLDGAVEELDVGDACGGGVAAGQLDHLHGGVEPVDVTSWPDPSGREQHVESASGPEVEDGLSLSEFGDDEWVAAAEAHPHGRRRHVVDVVVVAGPERRPGGSTDAVALPGPPGRFGVAGQDWIDRCSRVTGHQHDPSVLHAATVSSQGTASGSRPMISSAALGKQSRQRSLIRHQLELPTRSTSTKHVSPRICR